MKTGYLNPTIIGDDGCLDGTATDSVNRPEWITCPIQEISAFYYFPALYEGIEDAEIGISAYRTTELVYAAVDAVFRCFGGLWYHKIAC